MSKTPPPPPRPPHASLVDGPIDYAAQQIIEAKRVYLICEKMGMPNLKGSLRLRAIAMAWDGIESAQAEKIFERAYHNPRNPEATQALRDILDPAKQDLFWKVVPPEDPLMQDRAELSVRLSMERAHVHLEPEEREQIRKLVEHIRKNGEATQTLNDEGALVEHMGAITDTLDEERQLAILLRRDGISEQAVGEAFDALVADRNRLAAADKQARAAYDDVTHELFTLADVSEALARRNALEHPVRGKDPEQYAAWKAKHARADVFMETDADAVAAQRMRDDFNRVMDNAGARAHLVAMLDPNKINLSEASSLASMTGAEHDFNKAATHPRDSLSAQDFRQTVRSRPDSDTSGLKPKPKKPPTPPSARKKEGVPAEMKNVEKPPVPNPAFPLVQRKGGKKPKPKR